MRDFEGKGANGVLTQKDNGRYYERDLSANNILHDDRQECTLIKAYRCQHSQS